MSRRRRSRTIVPSSSDEEMEGAAPPLRAARRTALQLSQSTAGSGGTSSAGAALAALLAGSKPPAAAAEAKPRRSGRAVTGSQQRTAAAAPKARPKAAAAAGATAAGPAAASTQQPPAAAAAAAAAGQQGGGGGRPGELWVEKHAPTSEAELVVHKKKVQEVREWLEQQRASLGQPGVPRLLVVSGPSGCGKSAVLGVLAAALGFQLSEWRPPSAVGWEEAQYAGMQRRTKLEEFGEFVARTKMPHLSLHSSASSTAGAGSAAAAHGSAPDSQAGAPRPSQAAAAAAAAAAVAAGAPGGRRGRLAPSLLPTLVVVDDLPHAAGPEQRRQIAEALGDLAAGARFPVVVVATETSGKAQQERGLSAAAGTYQGLHKELVAVLEAHRAATVSFNPFTALNTAKALRAILDRERRALPDADVQAIAEQANGDLHNAISTLQFVCTGVAPSPPAPPAAKSKAAKGTKRKAAAGGSGGSGGGAGGEGRPAVGFAGRDSSLSLFHALGKLLYNKRLPQGAAAPQQAQQAQQAQQEEGLSSAPKRQWTAHGFWQQAAAADGPPALQLAAWAQRPPMEFDPEAVLAAAGLEAGSVTAFLHENVLNFIEDAAVEDAAACLEHLSVADAMASGRRWGTSDALMGDDDSASATLLDAAAASTAARGVCFANAHPAPRRWLPLKAPSVFTVAKGRASNGEELSRRTAATWALHGGLRCLEPAGVLAAEVLPYARAIAARTGAPALHRLQPARWSRFWGGQLYEQKPAGGGGDWQQGAEEDEEAAVAAAAAAGGPQHQQRQGEDAIEESEDEDDW